MLIKIIFKIEMNKPEARDLKGIKIAEK